MRSAIPAVIALLLISGLGACDAAEPPEPTVAGTVEPASPASTTTTSGDTPLGEQQVREAAEAEQPVTETMLREVAALIYPDLDQLAAERPRWLRGGTAACAWDRSSLSYIAKGNVPVESSAATADEVVAQLPDTWTQNEAASTGGNARYFEDFDGYLLMVSHQSDPDFVLLSVESPCRG